MYYNRPDFALSAVKIRSNSSEADGVPLLKGGEQGYGLSSPRGFGACDGQESVCADVGPAKLRGVLSCSQGTRRFALPRYLEQVSLPIFLFLLSDALMSAPCKDLTYPRLADAQVLV